MCIIRLSTLEWIFSWYKFNLGLSKRQDHIWCLFSGSYSRELFALHSKELVAETLLMYKRYRVGTHVEVTKLEIYVDGC